MLRGLKEDGLKEGEERVSLGPEKDTEKPVAACPGTA
jgi:hypothetical protein